MSTRIVHRLLCKIPVRNPKLQRAFSVMRTTHPRSAKPLFTLSCQSQRQLATTTKNHKDDDGDKSKKDGKESHADFEKQLLELQEERQLLFGEVSDEPTFVASDTQHSEFEKQLRDMNEERVQLFGDEDTKLEQHITKEAEEGTTEEEEEEEEMEAQLYRLKVEREEVFGFTHKEHTAWSNLSSGTEKLPASLMEEIEQARANADAAQEETLEASPQASNGNTPSKSIPAHGLTHLSEDGTSVNMVDVGDKAVTQRIARAETKVVFPPEVVETFQLNSTNDNELVGPKGPIFATAKLAGIMAAK